MSNTVLVQEKVIPLLQKLIRNACVNEGQPQSACESCSVAILDEFFRSYGLNPMILEKEKGRGNILVRVPGTDPFAPSLMYMGHLDVVPAEPEGWTHPPFEAFTDEEHVWGRGTVDMLNLVAVQAVAFAENYQNNPAPKGDLLFLAVADEENTGTYGARWLVSEHWDLVHADYVISELGGFFINKNHKQLTLASGEKGVAWVRISFRGKPGHGSMPYGSQNIAKKLSACINRLLSKPPKASIHPEYRSMVKTTVESKNLRSALLSPFRIEKGFSRLHRKDPGLARFLHSSSHMTVSPNVIRAGENINSIPGSGYIDVDIRILPGQTVEGVQSWLESTLGNLASDAKIEFLEFFPANLSKTDTALFNAIETITNEEYTDYGISPCFMGSVSDGRFWRNRGSIVYGFSLYSKEMTIDEFTNRIHGIDERISIESLDKSLQFFSRLPDQFYSTP